MVKKEVLHWYIGSTCNAIPRCNYCFEHDFPFNRPTSEMDAKSNSPENIRRVAEKVSSLGLQRVILGGGEPMIAKGVWDAMEILGQSCPVEVHTNALSFYRSKEKLEKLKDLADTVVIPIDSYDPSIQHQLRSYDTIDVFFQAFNGLSTNKRTDIGIHTVATAVNLKSIPDLYERLKDQGFDYWKIYEFNMVLAAHQLLNPNMLNTPLGQNKYIEAHARLRKLAGLPREFRRGKMMRSAQFAESVLELERQVGTWEDPRMSVVLLDDHPESYLFLHNSGDVFGYFPTLPDDMGDRELLGNIFSNNMNEIIHARDSHSVLEKDERIRALIEA